LLAELAVFEGLGREVGVRRQVRVGVVVALLNELLALLPFHQVAPHLLLHRLAEVCEGQFALLLLVFAVLDEKSALLLHLEQAALTRSVLISSVNVRLLLPLSPIGEGRSVRIEGGLLWRHEGLGARTQGREREVP